MRILHKIRKITIAALAVSFVMVTCFSGRASAASTSGSYYTTLSGYKGRIGVVDGRTGGVANKGDTFPVYVVSSLGHSEDVSGLKVSWSVNDSSAVSVTDNGFSKSDDAWEATVKILKAGTHQYGTDGWNPTVYATVNGHKLSDEIFVYPDATKVQKIGLSNSAVTIGGKGNTAKVKITFYPVKTLLITDNESVSSGNTAISTGSYHSDENGVYLLITAVANGTTNITVKDSNGAHATCQVTVTRAGAPAVSKKSTTTNKTSGKKTLAAKSNTANSQTGTTDNSGVTFNSIGQPVQNNDTSSNKSANSKGQSENKTSSGASSVGTVSYDIDENSSSNTDSDDSGIIGAAANNQNDAGSKSNMKSVLIGIIIIICACILAGCCIYHSKKKKAKEKLNETKEIKIKSHKK